VNLKRVEGRIESLDLRKLVGLSFIVPLEDDRANDDAGERGPVFGDGPYDDQEADCPAARERLIEVRHGARS
jgi:hypothetical protein